MTRVITNQECRLYHTPHCDLLNMPSCAECVMNGKDDEAEQIEKDLSVLAGLMPEEGIHPLFAGSECVLCKGEPNKRAYYGLLDIGHPEPRRTKRSIIGIKVKATVGSLLPVQLSVCAACRRRILTIEYLPVLLPLFAGILALAVLMLPGVSDALERTTMLLPFLLFVCLIAAAAAAGRLAADALEKKYAAFTAMDPFELPILRGMKDNGWFPLNGGGKRLRLVFVRHRMRMGVGTGTPEDAVCPAQE